MVDWVAIQAGLKRLRTSRPEFLNYSRFKKKSGINRGTVESTEDGSNKPSVDIIEKWVVACGSSVSKFFSELEDENNIEKLRPSTVRLTVLKENRKLHEQLEDLLAEKGEASEWISGNLKVFHRDYLGRMESHKSKSPPKVSG